MCVYKREKGRARDLGEEESGGEVAKDGGHVAEISNGTKHRRRSQFIHQPLFRERR